MITKQYFDSYQGQEIYAYTLEDKIRVTVLNLGATIIKLEVPDKNGDMVDVALGFTNANDVVGGDSGYMGSVVGRCGNRIAYGKFTLGGKEYSLYCNNGKAHLHGGANGFNKKVYNAKIEGDSLVLTMNSCDGDQGYPGNVEMTVKYTVEGDVLNIEYFGSTDQTTILNPTNHVYFNLNGESDGSILDNVVQIFADSFLAIDENFIPVAQVKVTGTPFDFTSPKPIGRDIESDFEQLRIGKGYDHNFCLNGTHVARAYSTKTGITLDCYTDLPGVQFYSGNFMIGCQGKSTYPYRSGFCLETQNWPDAINHPEYKQAILYPDQKLYTKTQYAFGVRKK